MDFGRPMSLTIDAYADAWENAVFIITQLRVNQDKIDFKDVEKVIKYIANYIKVEEIE